MLFILELRYLYFWKINYNYFFFKFICFFGWFIIIIFWGKEEGGMLEYGLDV